MPSMYERWSRSDPYDARIRNLAKARKSPRYHPPRPWRSRDESEMIQRYAFWWWGEQKPQQAVRALMGQATGSFSHLVTEACP